MIRNLFSTTLLTLLLFLSGGAVAKESEGTVLVTGANRGIGLEMARQLTEKGYTVIGTARKPQDARELKALGVRVEQLDVADSASVRALGERLQGIPIDILINNAGISGHRAGSFKETSFDEIAFTFDVNTLGPMRVTQSLLANLDAGSGKIVANMSSVMGSIAGNKGGGYYGYRASKTALNQFNKSLSVDLGRQGYICVVLHPGWVKTRMGGEAAPVQVKDSVSGLITVITGLKAADNGRFLDFQGQEIPW